MTLKDIQSTIINEKCVFCGGRAKKTVTFTYDEGDKYLFRN